MTDLPALHNIAAAISQYHAQRAIGFITTYGPERGSVINRALGLDMPLRDATPHQVAAVMAGAFGVSRLIDRDRVERYRAQLREVTQSSVSTLGASTIAFAERLSDYADFALRQTMLRRRDFLLLSGLSLAAGCGGSGSSSPSSPTPAPTPVETTYAGTVVSLDGKPVTGTIEFLTATSGPIRASGPITSANYSVKVTGNEPVKRVRMRGDGVCTTELNLGGTRDFKVLDRKLGIGDEYSIPPNYGVSVENPSFYDSINRHAPFQAPAGLRKIVEDVEFYVDAVNIGGGRQSPQERFDIIKKVIAESYPVFTGRPFAGVVSLASTLPEPGNGKVVFTFDYNHGSPRFNGHRIDGGSVGTGSFDLNRSGHVDRAELAATLMHIGTNDFVEPSIANSTHSGVFTFQPVDFNISAAALFETLGTKKARAFDGVWVESYEQPV